MKRKFFIFQMILITICARSTFGQYTTDVSQNTQVTITSQEINGIAPVHITSKGKAYIGYLDGYATLKLQLLDVGGVKLFPDSGITLQAVATSMTLANSTAIISDEQENAIVAFGNWETGNIQLFAVNPTGTILDTMTCGAGYPPKLKMLPSGEFIVAYTASDSSVIKKISFTGGHFSTVWTNKVRFACQSILPLPNGNFYMVSYARVYVGYAKTLANLINGSNGNPVWPHWDTCSSFSNSSIYTANVSACIGHNNKLYVSNTYFDPTNRRAYTQCIDSTGNILWGTGGKMLLGDGIFNDQIRVFSLFNQNTGELLCFVDGNDDFSGTNNKVKFQKIMANDTLLLPPTGLELVPPNSDAQLIGAGLCGTDAVFTYLRASDNNIMVMKVNNEGQILWDPDPLQMNSTNNSKSWVDASQGEILSDRIISVFQEDRNGHSSVFAHKRDCGDFLPIVTSINENNPGNIKIYPNPGGGKFIIENDNAGEITFELFDVTGQCVMHRVFNDRINDIDAASLAKGIYVIRLSDNKNTKREKIILE